MSRNKPGAWGRWAKKNPEQAQAHSDRRYARIRAKRDAALNVEVEKLLAAGFVRISDFPAYLINRSGSIYSTIGRRLLKVSPGTKPGGYQFVGIRNSNGTKYKMVHRLVAIQFIPNPTNAPAVNHIDGDKKHNSDVNLEWVTHTENSRHAFRTGLVPIGPNNSRAKLTADQVREIRRSTETCVVAGQRFGVCKQVICSVRNRKTYASVA